MTIALTNEFYELSFITFFSCFKSNFTQLPCPQTLCKSEQLSGYNHRFLFCPIVWWKLHIILNWISFNLCCENKWNDPPNIWIGIGSMILICLLHEISVIVFILCWNLNSFSEKLAYYRYSLAQHTKSWDLNPHSFQVAEIIPTNFLKVKSSRQRVG